MMKAMSLIGSVVCVLSAAAGGWPVLKSYEGENLRRIMMPVGGIGTGQISLSGTGGLVAWEIRNSPEKGHTPCRQQVHPAFVVRTRDAKGKVSARLLEGPLDTSVYEGDRGCAAPNHGYPRFRSCTFNAAYPLAQVALADPAMPVRATLEAMNPLVPGDEEASGIPAALMRWRIVNTGDEPLDVTVAAAIPNPSMGELSQDPCATNGLRGVVFRGMADATNSPAPFKRESGAFVVCAPEKAGTISVATRLRLASWSDNLDQFWRRLVALGSVGDEESKGEVEEWCDFGLLAVRATLKPGETREFPFVLAWRFPNRSAWGRTNAEYRFGAEDFVGNHYCQVYPTALTAAETLWRRLPELESKTLAFVNGILAAKAPEVVKEAALFNLSTLRSETCFRTADGHFFGWEGTYNWSGSCHGSCTHVWGYEHTLVDLWPNLAKDMCNLQFREAMDDEGAIRFRIGLPLATKARDWNLAAADGQMQCIVKAYECWKKTGDDVWLKSLYPQVKKALAFAWAKGGWDADRDGVMEGCQHNTMDVDYFGPNPQMEFLYLAALQATERMAAFVGETSFAAECAALRAKGAEWTEKNLFNGEYYEHRVASAARDYHPTTRGGWVKFVDPEHPDFQLAGGCLVDQLVGDYAARVVGLEPVADFAHARKATETILARNRREPDAPHFNAMRDYVLAGERSLRMAWYPPERMPKTPFPYYPETMTGFEYVVAAWLAETGDFAAAEEIVRDIRDRYDGRKRNPFDEAECGHHYSRALDSWSVLKAFAENPRQ